MEATFTALSAGTALQRGNVAALGGPEVLILDPPRRGLACQSWRSGLPAGQEEVDQIRQSFLAWKKVPMTSSDLKKMFED